MESENIRARDLERLSRSLGRFLLMLLVIWKSFNLLELLLTR
ncbi:MAG: hypothetical protein Q4D82_02335 [Neisseria sp.]|nr:hypothetical protein [Neisseria sp.]